MFKRYVVIHFKAKDGNAEYSAIHGYILNPFENLKGYMEIRKDCLNGIDFNGCEDFNFNYFQMNSITFVKKRDYISLFEINKKR